MSSFELLLFFIISCTCKAAEKSWQYDVNIFHPDNRLKEEDNNCRGIIFTEDITYTYMDEIVTQALVLPVNGKLYVSHIEFLDHPKCIKIGELKYHSWFNPNSWYSDDNAATPQTQRIPCRHDHVTFIEDLNSAIYMEYLGFDISVKSMYFGDRNMTNRELQYLIKTNKDWLVIEDSAFNFEINGEECEEEDGCLCHTYKEELALCSYMRVFVDTADDCEDPIQSIVDSCDVNKVCGGQILFTPLPGFNLQEFKKTIPRTANVDTHASKVTPDGKTNYIQVVFTSKSGMNSYEKSVEAATIFFENLLQNENLRKYKIRSPRISLSGPPKNLNKHLDASVSLVFGTLLGVLSFFVVLYVFYVGPLRNVSIASRFALQREQLRNFHPFSAVRYDNKEEERLMFERQSIAGSILSLERSFDNPMYGKPSTSSLSTLESTLNDQKWEETHSARENPMYEMKTREDNEEVETIK